MNEIERMADAIAQSGLFGVTTREQAAALMLVAQAEGRHPASAAKEYHIIKGRPALKADAMLARFQQAGGTIKWGERSDTIVSATFTHAQGGSVPISWTIEDAKRAGLTNNDNWRKYPRQMLSARVVSEGVRATYPSVVVGIYTPEEVQDFESPAPKVAKPAIAKPKFSKPESLEIVEVEVEALPPSPATEEAQEPSTAQRDALWDLMEQNHFVEADVMKFIKAKGVKTTATRIADLEDKIVARLVEKIDLLQAFINESQEEVTE